MSRIAVALAIATIAATVPLFAACAAAPDPDSEELVGADDSVAMTNDGISGQLKAGDTLTATANVNLRSKASTSATILHVVPLGATVTVVSADPQSGFYNVKHNGTVGWSYGQYYKASGGNNDPGNGPSPDRALALTRAQSAMGFSYWWGHGRFRAEGPSATNAGSCTGSCPNCSHGGSYGGDCSGLVAKVWQVPSSNNDLTTDEHPYSTASFVSDTSLWSTVSRSSLAPADAMVYHSGGAGHVFVYNSGDGWGSIDAYECKGCSAGCVHDVRTASAAYHGIRRAGF